jgi:putative transposase
MPWKESTKMSERIKFIGRVIAGEKMTDLCREFNISRVTGHKLWKRYQENGFEALNDQSRRPKYIARATPRSIEIAITDLKHRYPSWGAPKIWKYLSQRHTTGKFPVESTVHAILDRNGLVKKRTRKKDLYQAVGTPLGESINPNDIWCVDYKGQFKLEDTKYCYPLTISDHLSRYLLACEALERPRTPESTAVFERAFEEYGLPDAIRSDNGPPFAAQSIFGLSRLAVWWLRLGIKLQRIKPGHPEQNGRHERMHRTLKQAATQPAGKNILHQQEKFDSFMHMFNELRPHAGIEMKTPSEVYKKSKRAYPGQLEELEYKGYDGIRRVSTNGTVSSGKNRTVFITEALSGQNVGLTQLDDGLWGLTFMEYELGYYDERSFKFTPAKNPFLPDQL